MNFDEFDKKVNLEELQKNAEEIEKNGGSGNYKEVPAGDYNCTIDKLEIGATKDGRPMLKTQFRIVDGEFKKHCLFMNRVLYGTTNDANMIASAVGWLKTLEPSEDIKVEFKSYSQFNDLVMDIAEDVSGLEYLVAYDPKAFNSISIEDVFE